MRANGFDRKAYNRKNAQEWRLAHPEQRYASNKKWAEENPDKVNQSREAYALANPDKIREAKRKWKQTHPEAVMADKENRRAIVMKAPGKGVTGDDWKVIMASYSWHCVYCGKGGRLTMDHIVPLIMGGAHDPENIVPACKDCNCKKNKKSLLSFMYERRWNGTESAI